MKEELVDKPKAFTIKYKRPRGSRACVVCRSRKVRCDAEIHVPCTNCITFGCECTLPEAKKRGNATAESRAKRTKTTSAASSPLLAGGNAALSKLGPSQPGSALTANGGSKNDGPSANGGLASAKKTQTPIQTAIQGSIHAPATSNGHSGHNGTASANHNHNHNQNSSSSTHAGSASSSQSISGSSDTPSEPVFNISQRSIPPSLTSNYKNRPAMHKREMLTNGKASLTFLGSSSIGHFAQRFGQNHVELTDDLFDFNDSSLDSVELEILKLRGAFLLPPEDLCYDIVESYFEHVHPLMPVINRTEFMKKIKNPTDQPSLMLLQAVLLCGSRISRNPLLMDAKGSTNVASLTFFRRAKALYEANYESDPVSLIQTLILIGSFWEGPEDVTKNSFYWTRVAVGLAQGFGFQRDVGTSPKLLRVDKKIWRRIWWCLFEKDRNVAIAFGRPSVIDLNDCDVPMLTIDDFNEDDDNEPSPYPADHIQALYFIHLVKLAEITGIIVKHQYTVKAELMKRKNKSPIIQHCDMLMGIWFTNLPPQLVFSLSDKSTQNFYSCLLNAQYYNRLYLIHRLNLLRMAKSSSTNPNNYKYPSWGILFQAARMISIVSKNLLDKDQIKYCPVMFVYILFSALMMVIYHVDSPNNVIASTASDSLFVSKAVLREMGKHWPIAGVLLKLFDKYGNDKFKRAKIIENATQVEEYQEFEANKKDLDKQMSSYFNGGSGPVAGAGAAGVADSPQLAVSGVSPGDAGYKDQQHVQNMQFQHMSQPQKQIDHPTKQLQHQLQQIQHQMRQQHQQQQQTQQNQQTQQQPASQRHQFQSKPLEELIQQFKQPGKQSAGVVATNLGSHKTETSPTSSMQSFPDISLVTETVPANTDFFENFEPTQLFPEGREQSYPGSRAESPSAMQQMMNETDSRSPMNATMMAFEDSGVTEDMNISGQPATTPGGGLNTNFMDSSYINMNLQPSMNNFLTDDLGAFFNFQV